MSASLHGVLVIDKPAGWTSHDVVGWVRKWSGERKVGYAGTLDPAATGVLPLALNDGTRVLEYLTDATKAYVADITFGVETDSADIDGSVIATSDVAFSDSDLDGALAQFVGPILQSPPAHSAIRIGGKRAYDLARAGVEVQMPERAVTIYALDVLAWDGSTLVVSIECSKGTYIRSIARDLGRTLGSGAFLSNLVRTRSGPYCLSAAWAIAELESLDPRAEWPAIAEHPDSALSEWPAIVLSEGQALDWQFGRAIANEAVGEHPRARVYDNDGNWRGLARRDAEESLWKPLRVIKPR